MPAADLIDDLASRGQYHFTTDEMAARVGSSVIAARAALRRLQKKGVVATPHRGFHVIVPPEYRRLGCLPADQFIPQLMEHLGLDYYAALLTAGRYHGAAHQQPQVFQWRQTAPWIQDSQVEQDLILSRALVENTYHLDELLGTKLRALYQRKKSRDLFDLWTAHRSAGGPCGACWRAWSGRISGRFGRSCGRWRGRFERDIAGWIRAQAPRRRTATARPPSEPDQTQLNRVDAELRTLVQGVGPHTRA